MLLLLWQSRWWLRGVGAGRRCGFIFSVHVYYNVVQSGASTWIKNYPASPLAYPYHCAPFKHQSTHSQPTLIIHCMHGI